MRRPILLAIAFLCFAFPARADQYGRELGAVYLSAAPDHREPNLDFQSGVPFDFYVLSDVDYAEIGEPDWNENGGLVAWEGSFDLPPEIVITEWAFTPPTSVDACDPVANICVGLGAIIPAGPTPRQLMWIRGLYLPEEAPSDVTLRVGPSFPSHFSEQTPGWVDAKITLECTTDQGIAIRCYRAFARTPAFTLNCVNDCLVAVERSSWSGVKARFGAGR